MNKPLADKWVRKAIYTAINNMSVVDEVTSTTIQIPCFDTRVPTDNTSPYYVLMSTQTSTVDKGSKCEYSWQSSILLDIVTIYNSAGNTGSRLLADNILDKVRELTNDLTLDVSSTLKILRQTQDFPNDLPTITSTESVYRKFMRLEMYIN